MSKLGDLIEVHSAKPEFRHCEVCDGMGYPDLTKWYEFTWYSEKFKGNVIGTCLDCCKHMGTVTDWREDE